MMRQVILVVIALLCGSAFAGPSFDQIAAETAAHIDAISETASNAQATANANGSRIESLEEALADLTARVASLELITTEPIPPEPPIEPPISGVDMTDFGLVTRFASRLPVSQITQDFAARWWFTVSPYSMANDRPNDLAHLGALEVNLIMALPLTELQTYGELQCSGPLLLDDRGSPCPLLSYEDKAGGVHDLRVLSVALEKAAWASHLVDLYGVTRIDIDNFRMFDIGRTIGNLPADFRDADWFAGELAFLRELRRLQPDLWIHINPSVLTGDSIALINYLYSEGLVNSVTEEHAFVTASGFLDQRRMFAMLDAAGQIDCPIFWYVSVPSASAWTDSVDATWWPLAALVFDPGDRFGVRFTNRAEFIDSIQAQEAHASEIQGLGLRTERTLTQDTIEATFEDGRTMRYDLATRSVESN